MSFNSYFIFKIKLYKHHYLSIIIFGLMSIIMFVIGFVLNVDKYNKYSYSEYLLNTLYIFIAIMLRYFMYALEKYFMVKTHLRIYEFLFIQGLTYILKSHIN